MVNSLRNCAIAQASNAEKRGTLTGAIDDEYDRALEDASEAVSTSFIW